MISAVLFLVFNRPVPTQIVFSRIKRAKPPRLYISCDGPRQNNYLDHEKIEEVKDICKAIDWPCEVKTFYRICNYGAKIAVSSALTWFFANEEEGIILEDDCLPSDSFFRFCDEMLELHRDNERIYLISGYNKQQIWKNNDYDYFYSHLGGIWGWASWKRAWSKYDAEMSNLEYMIETNMFINLMGNRLGLMRQEQLIEAKKLISMGKIDAWDYQWGYTRHANQALSCVPSRSLIRNIGFGSDATHTTGEPDKVMQQELVFPLRLNLNINPDLKYDILFLTPTPPLFRVLPAIKRCFKKFSLCSHRYIKPLI